jgi:hypothetical protein
VDDPSGTLIRHLPISDGCEESSLAGSGNQKGQLPCPLPKPAPQAERRYVTWKVAVDAFCVGAEGVADFRGLSLKQRSGQMSTGEFWGGYFDEIRSPVHVAGDSDQSYTSSKLVAEISLCRFAPHVAMVQTTQARH